MLKRRVSRGRNLLPSGLSGISLPGSTCDDTGLIGASGNNRGSCVSLSDFSTTGLTVSQVGYLVRSQASYSPKFFTDCHIICCFGMEKSYLVCSLLSGI